MSQLTGTALSDRVKNRLGIYKIIFCYGNNYKQFSPLFYLHGLVKKEVYNYMRVNGPLFKKKR